MRYNANELAISRDRFDVAIHNALEMRKGVRLLGPETFLS